MPVLLHPAFHHCTPVKPQQPAALAAAQTNAPRAPAVLPVFKGAQTASAPQPLLAATVISSLVAYKSN